MRHYKRHITWQEMSHGQKMAAFLAMILQLSLLAAALLDINRRSAGELRGSKTIWTAISFVNFIGPLAYFALGRKPRALSGEGQISEEH